MSKKVVVKGKGKSNVVPFRPKKPKRGQEITLSAAITEAIREMNNQASPAQIRSYLDKYYAHREWKRSSVSSYLYFYSKGQKFAHHKRACYGLLGAKVKGKAA